ncbi:MAG: hypothetical protein GX589_03520 [Deltaproteobacteria bacterium]|jgi:hypothetical protein|nr:hypothetical protein [Deltaproteobacteria bacterium]
MATTNLKVNDRVKRVGVERSYGLIKEVREEIIGTSGDTKDKGILVKVQWDNGTISYFSPESLQLIEGGGS